METIQLASSVGTVRANWKQQLPTLCGGHVSLRELRLSDAASLLTMLNTTEVSRFIAPPPPTLEGFERFIEWSLGEQEAGRHACFAVVPAGFTSAVGIFQIRQVDAGFTIAEWGFALGSAFWGTGLFAASAELVLDFAFDTIGVHRVEARSAVQNGRGNGGLRKLGAVREGTTRRSVLCNGEFLDQHLWSILDTDWKDQRLDARCITVH